MIGRRNTLMKLTRMPFLLVFAACFAAFLVLFTMVQSHKKAEMLINHLQADYTQDKKEQLRNHVEQFALHISHQTEEFYRKLTSVFQERVVTALDMANEIYREGGDQFHQDIQGQIVAALRNIHYDKGLGDYSVYTGGGQVLLAPHEQQLEGKSAWDEQDNNGTFFVRELIRRAKSAEKDMFHWSLQRAGRSCKKIGRSTYFAEADLVIVAEVCIDELLMQRELQEWVENDYAHRYASLFVLDADNKVVVDPAPEVKRLVHYVLGERAFLQREVEKIGEGCFLYYPPDLSREQHEIVVFLKKIPEWQWMVGAILDMEVDSYLADKVAAIRQQNRVDFLQLMLGCLVIMGLASWLTFYLSQRVSKSVGEKMLFDGLTGLPTRNSFVLQMQSEVQQGKTLVIFDIDIDNFSAINERFNQSVGDSLLCGVAERLREIVASDSCLCRVCGDEFLLYFEKPASSDPGSTDVFSEITTVRNALNKPFNVGNEQVRLTCAIGVVRASSFSSSADELLRKANIVLFRSKSEGRNRYSCYNSGIEKMIQRDKTIADSLMLALSGDEIQVVYQPQIDSKSGKLYGVEALCRWTSANLGFVSPNEFIPIAEKNGFILSLGYFVFRRACLDILQWMENSDDAIKVSINISPRQLLHNNFIEDVSKIVDEVGISPGRITLEITENLLIKDVETVAPILYKLSEIGFDISLDDFGTGASSLTHIYRLPIGELKIDRSLIMNMFESSKNESLVKSVLSISCANNLRIVAEGVETQQHVDWLKNYDCDLLQGYFFSKPVTLNELQAMYALDSSENWVV